MQIFRVKKPSCKILKTKNCVPFEVQYTSSLEGQMTYYVLLHSTLRAPIVFFQFNDRPRMCMDNILTMHSVDVLMSLREFISSVIMLNGLKTTNNDKSHEKLPRMQGVEYILNNLLYLCIAWGRKGCTVFFSFCPR